MHYKRKKKKKFKLRGDVTFCMTLFDEWGLPVDQIGDRSEGKKRKPTP